MATRMRAVRAVVSCQVPRQAVETWQQWCAPVSRQCGSTGCSQKQRTSPSLVEPSGKPKGTMLTGSLKPQRLMCRVLHVALCSEHGVAGISCSARASPELRNDEG